MNRGFLSKWNHSEVLDEGQLRAFRKERLVSYAAIGVVLVSIAGFSFETAAGLIGHERTAEWAWVTEAIIGRGLLGFFLFSALVFQLTRLGYLIRFSKHRAMPDSELERVYAGDAPRLAILVPSYKEEPNVVRQTLLAAALQQSPNRRVVLLIDDPSAPGSPEDAAGLARTRDLPREMNSLFAAPARKFARALAEFEQRRKLGTLEPRREIERLTALQRDAANWLDKLAKDMRAKDHTDALFIERILGCPARSHLARGRALAKADPRDVDLLKEYRRLAALFRVEVTSFERKRYANLSHEPNKAMNLNSYLALMGRAFQEVESANGLELEPADDAHATLRVPNADFVIVLDADSLILPEYSLRLMNFACRPGNERIAVVQTPYASVPGAASEIERVAGATTDVQLMSHQGATLFGAGSWVGASALVRRAALEDIVVAEKERGYTVLSYIRDRTLNEDTDTTVDLNRRNWTVYNYPDRLAYSATPPDFGSLLIQRRRWATGGLIILPNVLRYILDRPTPRRVWEGLVRAQYILAAPLGSVGIVILMLYPFQYGILWSVWLLPAFFAWLVIFARDLMHNGSRLSDLFRAMALNTMLLPVNLAGAVTSIRQIWSGRKIPFQRTPKIRGRTSAPAAHIAAQLAFPLLASVGFSARIAMHEWPTCLFFIVNVATWAYALHVFIGWHAAREDLRGGFEPRLRPLLKPLLNKWRPINER
jgi:cellulose synthase/poly-beta-1,6-N-acetylglucosamine synthase-like glycosyltransferase